MAKTASRSTKLLIVDDDPSIVRVLTTAIKRSCGEEMELTPLTDPQLARSYIDKGDIDILITDLEMPGVNGLELLRHAKHRNPCTQVLVITAHSTVDALLDALETGATDYLLKPLVQAELLELVADAHRRLQRWRKALGGTLAARHGNV